MNDRAMTFIIQTTLDVVGSTCNDRQQQRRSRLLASDWAMARFLSPLQVHFLVTKIVELAKRSIAAKIMLQERSCFGIEIGNCCKTVGGFSDQRSEVGIEGREGRACDGLDETER